MKILYQTGYFNFAKTKTVIKRVRLGRPGTSLKMGLLGMANIGKSSTFNLLSNLNVPAENIPFCTIDPNEAFITVRDPRFYGLRDLYKPQKQVGPMLRIVDIAGLVKGASQGYGLGNQFLSHVMQVDGLYHVVRCFQGNNIAHTQGDMDPVRDIKIIRHELIQKDLDIITKKLAQFQRKAKKSQDKQIKLQYQIMLKAKQTLKNQIQIRNIAWKTQQIQILNKFLFLTSKPMIYLLNLSKQDYLANKVNNHKQIEEVITENGKFQAKCIPYSVQYQNQRKQQNQSSKTQIDSIIKGGYQQLELIHFYTVGKDEVRAWAIRKGQNAVEAGSKIHSDFGRGFINAQVIHSDVLLKNPEYKQKLQKHSKKQGKTYIVKDGDIVHFNSKIK